MKGMLTVNMPESCQECQFASGHTAEDGMLRCVALWSEGEDYDWEGGPARIRPEPEKRHAWCPLVPVETEGAR